MPMGVQINDNICWKFILIASAKITEHEGSISTFSFYGQLSDYYSHMLAFSTCRWVFLFVPWLPEQNENSGRI